MDRALRRRMGKYTPFNLINEKETKTGLSEEPFWNEMQLPFLSLAFWLFLVLDSVFHSVRLYFQRAGMTFKCKIKRAKQKTQALKAAGGARLLALLWWQEGLSTVGALRLLSLRICSPINGDRNTRWECLALRKWHPQWVFFFQSGLNTSIFHRTYRTLHSNFSIYSFLLLLYRMCQ